MKRLIPGARVGGAGVAPPAPAPPGCMLGLRSEAEPVPMLARTVLLVVLLVLALAALGWSTGA